MQNTETNDSAFRIPHFAIVRTMPALSTHNSTFPRWYRGLLVAVAIGMLCACNRAHGQSCPTGGCEQAPCESQPAPCIVPDCAMIGPPDEYLCDGGDYGSPVGVKADWSVEGLEQEDTVAHFDTLDGRVLVEPSNRVCIYAPRFGAVRRVVNLMESEQQTNLDVFVDPRSLALSRENAKPAPLVQEEPLRINLGADPPSLLKARQQAGQIERLQGVADVIGLVGPYCNLQVMRLGIMDNAEKPWLAQTSLAALTWSGDQAAQVTINRKSAQVIFGRRQPGVIYELDEPNHPCLRLIKCASAKDALPGEEIEFTLRFDNIGDAEIGNVTIMDNLATRLAYVPESAKSSLDADFSTGESASGSLVLRWEIKEPLAAGKGGVLTFKVRVR